MYRWPPQESRLDSGDLEKTKYDVPDLDSILKTANKSKEDLGIMSLFYSSKAALYQFMLFVLM